MKNNIYHNYDPISIISLPTSLKLTYEKSSIHEGAAMLLLHFFMKKQAPSSLIARITLLAMLSSRRLKKWTLTTYLKVVIYLLETFATRK